MISHSETLRTPQEAASHHDPKYSATLRLRVVFPEARPDEVDARSPSLRGRKAGDLPACELKFLLDEATANDVERRLASSLAVDPHGRGGGYHIATLYCDTPAFDVFHRIGRHRLTKFRLRRYGDSPNLFLERKSKRGYVVRKRRSTIALDRLGDSLSSLSSRADAGWYRNQLHRNGLSPVCLIEYDRAAYCGVCSEGPLRLTFDRRIRGGRQSDWSLAATGAMRPLLGDRVVCEFKFRGTLPRVFKSAIESLRLSPFGVSKYRHCIQSCFEPMSVPAGSEPNA